MAMTSLALGLGRKVLLEAFVIEQKKVPSIWRKIVGRVLNTTQVYEIIRSYKGLGPAEITPEGEQVRMDDMAILFSRNFQPYQVTKGIRYTVLTTETAQYKDVLAKQPQFANSFEMTRNQVVANLLVLGFTDTTAGMNSETLFSATHATGVAGTTQSNLITGPLSPYGIEQALAVLGRQKSPINQPMPVTGKVLLIVPPELAWAAKRMVSSPNEATTPNNDINPFKDVVEYIVNPYLPSTTAWFMVAMDPTQNGLFMLEQMAYDIKALPMSTDMFYTWIAYESYVPGWMDWRGTVASTGL